MIKIKHVVITIFVSFFVIFFCYFIHLYYDSVAKTKNRHYRGIIQDIRILDKNRGLPDLKINDMWIHIIYEPINKNDILIGDSIAKDSGSLLIKVFRKRNNGNWQLIIYR